MRFRVCGAGGELCLAITEEDADLLDLKAAIEAETGIPVEQQRLLCGLVELRQGTSLRQFHRGTDQLVELLLIRRSQQQVDWLRELEDLGPQELRHMPHAARADREVVMQAVAAEWSSLEHASPELRADREIVREALKGSGRALLYASEALHADRELILEAVSRFGSALRYAAPALQADREVVLAAVVSDGFAVQFASPEMRADREIALAAVQRDAFMVIYLSEELQKDPEIVQTVSRS